MSHPVWSSSFKVKCVLHVMCDADLEAGKGGSEGWTESFTVTHTHTHGHSLPTLGWVVSCNGFNELW